MERPARFHYVTNRLFIAAFVFTITVGGGGQACLCGWSYESSDGNDGCLPPSEHICDDGLDNDEDSLIDCQDSDCAGDPACSEAAHCDNDHDDDGDSLVDCQDPDCDGTPECRERECDNGIDDNYNGLVDCNDPDCLSAPPCIEDCSDGVDNDLDGSMDCVDPDCFGHTDCAASVVEVTLLLTSGLRSHANGVGCLGEYDPLDATGLDPVRGGYARLAGRVGEIRAAQGASQTPVVLLDTGDFMGGSVYDHVVGDPVQLRYFQRAGYDAVIFGASELAQGPDALAALLSAAATPLAPPAFDVPVVVSNLVFSSTDPGDDTLEALRASGVLQPWATQTLSNGLVVGFLGRLGPRVAETTGHEPLTFDLSDFQGRVDALISTASPDLVVLLSHGGLDHFGNDADEALALGVQGIDVIATSRPAGSDQAVRLGDTVIFPAGPDGTYLSQLDLTFETDQGAVLGFSHQFLVIDATGPADASMQQEVDLYTAALDVALLASFGVGSASPVAETAFDLATSVQAETALGNLTADALRAAATQAVVSTAEATPFAVALLPDYMLQDDLLACTQGMLTFADLYNVVSYNFTPATDQLPDWPGSPLVSFYLTAPELRNAAETLGLAEAAQWPGAFLNYAGLRMELNHTMPAGMKVENVYLCGDTLPPGVPHFGEGDLFSEQCATLIVELGQPWYTPDHVTRYRVVTDLSTARLLGSVSTATYPITPKDATGQPLPMSTLQDLLPYRIDADPAAPGVQELKAWQALHWFVSTQLTDDGSIPGLPEIPLTVYSNPGTGMGRFQ